MKDFKARDYRSENLKRRYGLTVGEWDILWSLQGGRCPCCDMIDVQLFVDHDHSTGKVRGLLCSGCNSGVGYFKENPEAMRNAAKYVELHAGEKALDKAKELVI